MTSYNGFEDTGFNAFCNSGFNARNGCCVASTLATTGRYVWSLETSGVPLRLTFAGDVVFDSEGRLWENGALTKRPKVHDIDGSLLFEGPEQSGNLTICSDAGHGRAVFGVWNNSDPLDQRADKLVCFNRDDASVRWTYTRASANFNRVVYANGVVFASFWDGDTLLDTVASGDNVEFAWVLNPNSHPARRTVALDADTGALLGVIHGFVQAPTPSGGLVVLHDGDNFLPDQPLPQVLGVNLTFPSPDYICYESDWSTVAWSEKMIVEGTSLATVDVDRSGAACLLGTHWLVTLDAQGSRSIQPVLNLTWFLSLWGIAIEDCSNLKTAYISGGFSLHPDLSPREWTLQHLSLNSPALTSTVQSNFPSDLGSTVPIRVNRKWSLFT